MEAPGPDERLFVFDPWSAERGLAGAPRPGPRAALEPEGDAPSTEPEPESQNWADAGISEMDTPVPDPSTHPSEFLRRVVVPGFQRFARRLEASRHYTTVQDLLDLPTPTVRVLIWPRPGLLDPSESRILATFQLVLERQATRVRTSYWVGAKPEVVIPMAEVPLDRLAFSWVETQLLDFVQRVLDRV